MKKRYLSILLVFALCLGLTVSALASDEPGEDVSAAEAEASAVCEPSEDAEEPAVETPAEEPAQDGETGYSLWIMGKQVTSGNKNDVLGNGRVKYDSTRRVLSLSGSLASGTDPAVRSEIADLYIDVQKNVTVSSSNAAITIDGSASIGGSGKLTVNGSNTGIFVRSGKLSVLTDLDVAGGSGITGINGSSGEALYIGPYNVHIAADSYGVINFADITLDRCAITSPAGGKVKGGYAIYDQSGSFASEITIAPRTYGLTVCGIPVTGKNCGDVMGNGVFSFDPEKNALTVASSYEDWNSILVSNDPGLTVYVEKTLTLTSSGYTAVIANESMTFTGPGRLNLKSTAGNGLMIGPSAAVTVADTWVNITGSITGNGGNGRLLVQNSHLAAENESGAIHSLAEITLVNSRITKPAHGTVSGGRVLNGESIAPDVVINPVTYDLAVAGTQVTGANAADVLGDGVFSYDHAAKKLTIRGSCTYSGGSMIESGIDGLTIYVARNASLTTTINGDNLSAHHVFVLGGGTTLTGPGRLTVSAIDYGFCCPSGSLTILDMDLNITGSRAMSGLEYAELTIRNSHVYAEASNKAVCDWKSITLDHCAITFPTGGTVNGSGTDIVDKSGSLARVVIINTGALPGDADGNGYVQPADAALVLGAPASCDQDAADVSGNNTVDPMDAAMILQYCAGILAGFPAG